MLKDMSKDLCKIKKKQYIKGYQGLIFEVVDEDQVIKSIKVKKDTGQMRENPVSEANSMLWRRPGLKS